VACVFRLSAAPGFLNACARRNAAKTQSPEDPIEQLTESLPQVQVYSNPLLTNRSAETPHTSSARPNALSLLLPECCPSTPWHWMKNTP
jgi:hypothetical protein